MIKNQNVCEIYKSHRAKCKTLGNGHPTGYLESNQKRRSASSPISNYTNINTQPNNIRQQFDEGEKFMHKAVA